MKHPNESRRFNWRLAGAALGVALVLCGTLTAGSAQAARTLLLNKAVNTGGTPTGQIDGACGIAVTSKRIYVSSYYDQAVFAFESPASGSGAFLSAQSAGIADNGPCGLALSPNGSSLYINYWHELVLRLQFPLTFDEEESTGVAVDQASGDVYVNDRTYVAVYESTGAPVLSEGEPLRIGLGTLGNGYGVAVSGGRVYVPDAADRTVKVYEPALDVVNPVQVISGSATPQNGFKSLVDAAIAIDPSNGHVLVLDNLQPGFEQPQGAIDEFSDTGAFLGQLGSKVNDAEPSGLALDSDGNLYATSGNSEKATVLKFGPYTESAAPASSGAPAPAITEAVPRQALLAPAVAASPAVPPSGAARPSRHPRHPRGRHHRRPQMGKGRQAR